MKVMKPILGENHVTFVLVQNNYGQILRDLGEFEKAGFIFSKVLKIEKAFYGENHLIYIKSLSNSTGILYEQGNY